jgi:hypothetical protein
VYRIFLEPAHPPFLAWALLSASWSREPYRGGDDVIVGY